MYLYIVLFELIHVCHHLFTLGLEGGPLFSFDGKFVGMNLFLDMNRAFFLPWGTILERMEHFWTSLLEE